MPSIATIICYFNILPEYIPRPAIENWLGSSNALHEVSVQTCNGMERKLKQRVKALKIATVG